MGAGIRDRVAVVGMGCTPFGEHWDKGAADLVVDASTDACSSAGVAQADIEAYWLGTLDAGLSGLTLSHPLKIENRPVTRVENFCATGSEAFRNACYAVASGAFDRVMAIGVEKLKDSPHAGINLPTVPTDGTAPQPSVPAMFSFLATSYCDKYGLSPAEMRDVLTAIACKNHANGARNPRAQFRAEVSKEVVESAPPVAGMLGVFDCSGVADGSAAAVLVPAADALEYTDTPLYVKALSFVAGSGTGAIDPRYDYTTFPEVVATAADAYAQAGVDEPRRQLALAEVHDCFTPTELVYFERFARLHHRPRSIASHAADILPTLARPTLAG